MERIHTRAVCEELQPVERTHVIKACGGLSSVREKLSLEQGESVSAPPEEEQVAERICGELTTDPCITRGEEVEKSGSKVRPWWKGGVFKIWLYLS